MLQMHLPIYQPVARSVPKYAKYRLMNNGKNPNKSSSQPIPSHPLSDVIQTDCGSIELKSNSSVRLRSFYFKILYRTVLTEPWSSMDKGIAWCWFEKNFQLWCVVHPYLKLETKVFFAAQSFLSKQWAELYPLPRRAPENYFWCR